MLKCREFTSLASEYVDGKLSRSRRFAMRFHLLLCNHCRRFIRGWRQTVDILKRLERGREEPSDDLITRIDNAVVQRLTERKPPPGTG